MKSIPSLMHSPVRSELLSRLPVDPVVKITPPYDVIPVSKPHIDQKDINSVLNTIKSGWVSSLGTSVSEFATSFANYVGSSYGVPCSSCTAAIHLALAAIGVGRDDEVILPTFTMIATIRGVLQLGATPILVDSDPLTGNLSIRETIEKVTKKTKAIIVVHTYGVPVDMDPLVELCNRRNIFLIEDAAEAHGAEYKGRRVGSIGDIGCFSFYSNKIITTGEGGVITTDRKDIADRCRTLMNHAFSEERHFWHKFEGYNYRMTALQASLGLSQLSQINQFIAKRNIIKNFYDQHLQDLPLTGPAKPPQNCYSVCWMYGLTVTLGSPVSKNQIRQYLASKGIETRSYFIPMHLQPILAHLFIEQSYPVAETLMERGFYIPTYYDLSNAQLEYIVSALRGCCR